MTSQNQNQQLLAKNQPQVLPVGGGLDISPFLSLSSSDRGQICSGFNLIQVIYIYIYI